MLHTNTNHSAREVNYTADILNSLAVTQPTYESLITEACDGSDINDVAAVADDGHDADQRSLSVLLDERPPTCPMSTSPLRTRHRSCSHRGRPVTQMVSFNPLEHTLSR